MDLETLRQRAEIIKQIRVFFDNKGYLEIDTHLLSPNLIPESCLEVFGTELLSPSGSKEKNKPLWLIPSPEIHMKKLIAQHKINLYQICKCFRNGESIGHLHSPEFTMLEYYTMNADYTDSLYLTEDLFAFLSSGKQPLYPFIRITVAEAFERYAGFDLFSAAESQSKMEEQARKLGLEPAPGLPVSVLFDLIFIHAVEPHLKMEKPVALLDYPAFVSCLAKQAAKQAAEKSQNGKKTCNQTVERWELYYNGIELANCFSEETDPDIVKYFFITEQAEKEKKALVKHNIDNDYWKIFKNFPKCSGVALGIDRLIMTLTGKSNISDVIIN